MRKVQLLIVSICIGFFIFGCERDDICSEAIQVTPKLIIEFYDINEPETLKDVVNLSVFAVGEDTIAIGTTSRLEIPLRTNQESTRYGLIRFANNEEFVNVDEINFTYVTRDVYENRACGFKTEFIDFQAARILETNTENNWLRSVQVQQTLIDSDNEDEVHLFIFH